MRYLLFAIFVAAGAQPVAGAGVDFARDVRPIFEARCVSCHGPEKAKAGWRLEVGGGARRGGGSGVAIVPGRASDSLLIKLVEGADADRVTPAKGERLTAEQVAALRRWV